MRKNYDEYLPAHLDDGPIDDECYPPVRGMKALYDNDDHEDELPEWLQRAIEAEGERQRIEELLRQHEAERNATQAPERNS